MIKDVFANNHIFSMRLSELIRANCILIYFLARRFSKRAHYKPLLGRLSELTALFFFSEKLRRFLRWFGGICTLYYPYQDKEAHI